MIISLLCLLSVVACLEAGSDNDLQFNQARLQFSTELFQKLAAQDQSKNVIASPSSIYRTLLMMYIASAGKTEKTLEHLMRFDKSNKPDKSELMKIVFDEVHRKNKDDIFELDLISRVFVTKSIRVKKEMEKRFGDLIAVFKTDTEQETEVNNWIANKTKGMISELFIKGMLKPGPKALFVNAAYFKALWVRLLNGGTSEKPFTLSDGRVVQTQYMSANKEQPLFRSMTDVELNAQIISLPYRAEAISYVSMIIIMPKSGSQEKGSSPIAEVVKKLNSTKLTQINSALNSQQECDTDVSIPKFESEASYNLEPIFKDLGANDLLGSGVDLTNLFEPGQDLAVSQILHKARVNVYENGTEAMAASVVATSSAVLCNATFHADRPFIYIIYDTNNNVAHYMGILKTPKHR